MEVRNIRWVGVRARHYDAMVGFLRQVLALRVNFQEPTTTEFSTSEGDEIQVMAPDDAYYDGAGTTHVHDEECPYPPGIVWSGSRDRRLRACPVGLAQSLVKVRDGSLAC